MQDAKVLRPLTRYERARFAGLIGADSLAVRVVRIFFITIVSIGILAGVAAWLGQDKPALKGRQNTILLLICIVSGGIGLAIDAGLKYPRSAKQYVQELREGHARVRQFELLDAVEVDEFEDNGYAFYLKSGDGTVLFLMGQYLYEIADKMRFPSSKLEVAYSPTSNFVLSVKPLGTYLKPTYKRSRPLASEFAEGRLPKDGNVMSINFETLKH